MGQPKALITGITGQDGSYLAEHLVGLGYEVYGLVRRVAIQDQQVRYGRLVSLLGDGVAELHGGTIQDYGSVYRVVADVKPDEVYHLAAQSFVAESFVDAHSTMDINITGTLNVLTAVRDLIPECRVYFAASSEMFGKVSESPQNEQTRFYGRSPYGISKIAGFELTRHFREAYGMFACSGILFNHESPRRGMEFVTRKISRGVAEIKLGLREKIGLGNMEARRDWGHSKDYVKAMHLMLQQDEPDDYVVATGETHSVRRFCELAFMTLGMDWKLHVEHDEHCERPSDVELLCGDASKAKWELKWKPETTFEELVKEMVMADYDKGVE